MALFMLAMFVPCTYTVFCFCEACVRLVCMWLPCATDVEGSFVRGLPGKYLDVERPKIMAVRLYTLG